MKLNQLFEMQKELDDRIVKEHGLEKKDLFSSRLLAFYVELGELAQETRCFKYWSNKPASERNVILEEYVDGLHFILSKGLNLFDRGRLTQLPPGVIVFAKVNTVIGQFNYVIEAAAYLNMRLRDTSVAVDKEYIELIRLFLGLGEMLGFNSDEITKAYFAKNEINHQRQENGY